MALTSESSDEQRAHTITHDIKNQEQEQQPDHAVDHLFVNNQHVLVTGVVSVAAEIFPRSASFFLTIW
jgi:hypothetical protein